MGLQFQGAIDNISEPQLAFIRDVFEKRGYKDTKVVFEPVGQAGDNYIANVKRIIVQDDNGEFRMIAKFCSQPETVREIMAADKLFKNEHIMYSAVLPKFQQLEEDADIPKEDRLRFAECYGSFTMEPHEVILLEDLTVPGFSMLDRFKPLSDDCVKSILRNFALLHSLSYVLKHRELETFNEFKNSLFDMWSNLGEKPETTAHFKHLETIMLAIIDGDTRKRHLKGCVLRGFSLCSKLAKQDAGSKYSVIIQGDAWTNNVLFKVHNDSLQSVLIDYQLSKATNPTCDLIYTIFNCTDHKSRMEHFHDWIDYYHSELDKALGNYGLKANYVYSRDQLDADLKRYARIIFGLNVVLAWNLVMKPEDAAKMMQVMQNTTNPAEITAAVSFGEATTQALKRKLEGLIDSYMAFGLI